MERKSNGPIYTCIHNAYHGESLQCDVGSVPRSRGWAAKMCIVKNCTRVQRSTNRFWFMTDTMHLRLYMFSRAREYLCHLVSGSRYLRLTRCLYSLHANECISIKKQTIEVCSQLFPQKSEIFASARNTKKQFFKPAFIFICQVYTELTGTQRQRPKLYIYPSYLVQCLPLRRSHCIEMP